MDAGPRGRDPAAGGATGIYGVVEKPHFVVVAPLDEKGRLHLVQQYRYPVKGRYWEFPQGAWEQSPDADPAVVARDELRAETGLGARDLVCAGHLFQGYGFSTQGYHVFLATGLYAETAERDAEEQDLVSAAFDLAEVERMLRDGLIKDGNTAAAFGLLRLKGLL